MKKVGLSLSLCVKDMVYNRVAIEEVECIIAGTRITSDAEFEQVLDQYACTYWSKDPEYGKFLARYLWEEGKIYQPRLNESEIPKWHTRFMSRSSYWLTEGY